MRRSGFQAMLVTLVAVAACAPFRRAEDTTQPERVPVVVVNQNFYQATIFAISNGSRVRLGEVPGNSSGTFSAPRPVTGEMRVEIRLLAVGAFTSWPISVARGDTVQVTVPPDLHRRPARPR